MNARSAMLILLAVGLVLAVAGPVSADMLPGVKGDGIADLYVDVVPEGYTGPETTGMWLETDGNLIGGYIVESELSNLTGANPIQIQWVFQEDKDEFFSSNLAMLPFTDPDFNGIHYFGDVMGPHGHGGPPKSIDPLDPPEDLVPDGLWDLPADLTFTYTTPDAAGTFYGTLIVPEPGTMMMLLCGAIGLLLAWRRRS